MSKPKKPDVKPSVIVEPVVEVAAVEAAVPVKESYTHKEVVQIAAEVEAKNKEEDTKEAIAAELGKASKPAEKKMIWSDPPSAASASPVRATVSLP